MCLFAPSAWKEAMTSHPAVGYARRDGKSHIHAGRSIKSLRMHSICFPWCESFPSKTTHIFSRYFCKRIRWHSPLACVHRMCSVSLQPTHPSALLPALCILRCVLRRTTNARAFVSVWTASRSCGSSRVDFIQFATVGAPVESSMCSEPLRSRTFSFVLA